MLASPNSEVRTPVKTEEKSGNIQQARLPPIPPILRVLPSCILKGCKGMILHSCSLLGVLSTPEPKPSKIVIASFKDLVTMAPVRGSYEPWAWTAMIGQYSRNKARWADASGETWIIQSGLGFQVTRVKRAELLVWLLNLGLNRTMDGPPIGIDSTCDGAMTKWLRKLSAAFSKGIDRGQPEKQGMELSLCFYFPLVYKLGMSSKYRSLFLKHTLISSFLGTNPGKIEMCRPGPLPYEMKSNETQCRKIMTSRDVES